MGFSFKSAGNLVGKAAGAALGGFLGGPAGAAAGFTGADAVLGVVGLGSDQLAAEQQWKYQKMASDYAFNQNVQMWNLANAYNDPVAQMQRLAAAGLNPNLVYGGGNVTGNSSSSTPSYDRPNVQFTDRSIQRQQLALAMAEHKQRITNQAIENELARQRLVLSERDANRSDMLANAQVAALKANLGLRAESNAISRDYNNNLYGLRVDEYNWRRYQGDVNNWDRRFEKLPWLSRVKIMGRPAEGYQFIGPRPRFMDYSY